MDNERRNSFEFKEPADNQRRNSKDNTEYVPTRCRITKPIPPKPAANPMQFVKIGPCGLYRKAQEQLKKVEEVKAVKPEIRDEAEDWQAVCSNLDNWKSSRRKRQEHIIERVVEVKKFEQQEQEKTRRKSKTFNEILEERGKRKTKISISLYENDDPNDLSDYGIGTTRRDSSSTETSRNDNDPRMEDSDKSIEPATEDYNAVQDKNVNETKEENRTQMTLLTQVTLMTQVTDNVADYTAENANVDNGNEISRSVEKSEKRPSTQSHRKEDMEENSNIQQTDIKERNIWNETETTLEPEQYTYESAIQGYRTRVISKTNMNSTLSMPSYTDANADLNVAVPKGSILRKKELFENDKQFEINTFESSTSRRLSDDFVHSQSLKERLLSLEKFTEQPLRATDTRLPVTEISDIKNNNTPKPKVCSVRNRVSMLNNLGSTTPEVVKPKSVINNNWSNKTSERFSSPEPDVFVTKLDNIHRSLDNLTDTTNESMHLDRVQSLEGLDYCHSNYPASNSSTELLVLSSQYGDTDREDSGIHTADVSCSVSQADEPVEDPDLSSNVNKCQSSQSEEDSGMQVISPLSTENVDYMNTNVYPIGFDGVFISEEFPLGPPTTALEPPKEKPPPPPVNDIDEDLPDESELKRLNSTKRIKKEMRMKRSSFLGIEPDDQPEVEPSIQKPPDINSFLQKESRLEKQLYKKTQSQSQLQPQLHGQSSYSEAGDSQDSGVELERGRLSSDTWCSSLPDSGSTGPTGITHSRQGSEPCTTNSITSEEDEITKKEREIIEMVEKEEKWRDNIECVSSSSNYSKPEHTYNQHAGLTSSPDHVTKNLLKREVPPVTDYISEDDEHSEVLRVEHELLQLEREEMERQRENMIFRESRARLQSKAALKNKRLSLEDISGTINQQSVYNMYQPDTVDYRKSMPELQQDVQVQSYKSRAPSKLPVRPPPVRETSYLTRKSPNIDVGGDEASAKVAHPHPISRHSLQMLSAAPRSRLVPQDNWIHPKPTVGDPREKFNYNQHWLIQEAEQRRISEQQKYAPPSAHNWKLTRSEKHLPDSVIQTLTQRVQNKVNLSDRNILSRRLDGPLPVQLPVPVPVPVSVPVPVPTHYGSHSPHSVGHALPIHHPHLMMEESQDKMLSVSGKKKCSYCGNELGRGAAMIIESLCLFYHMDCFKCCVCHMQLGDGLMGTDVRVRNNKLHCHNCYSSDDGVKFSCV